MKFSIVFLLLSFSAFGQNENISSNYYQNYALELVDSTQVDSIKPHSIRKAVILSTCLPGAGQIYNHIAMPKGKKKAFWKVPLIYAGLGASTYFLIKNQITQKSLKQEYTNRLDGNVGEIQWSSYDDAGVLTLYNQYLNWRDLSILAVGLVYIIQVADAGVEAHFINFDVSEDLSLTFDPIMMNLRSPGLKLSLNFR
ncbi:MAG: DUF5683 domain-containing protein [Crocinitomicaceae bacterium]|nr:DUF5683 domain-containing protein [Crocinitomicaceae bacterium]